MDCASQLCGGAAEFKNRFLSQAQTDKMEFKTISTSFFLIKLPSSAPSTKQVYALEGSGNIDFGAFADFGIPPPG
jgi:hypothetical protein